MDQEKKSLSIDLKRTSLEEVFLLENDSREIDNDQDFDHEALDDCWKELISETKEPSFLSQFKVMVMKSKHFNLINFLIFSRPEIVSEGWKNIPSHFDDLPGTNHPIDHICEDFLVR